MTSAMQLATFPFEEIGGLATYAVESNVLFHSVHCLLAGES